jgi:hypothetical protein
MTFLRSVLMGAPTLWLAGSLFAACALDQDEGVGGEDVDIAVSELSASVTRTPSSTVPCAKPPCFTGFPSASRHANVDDAIANSDTDYNYTTTVGSADAYGISLSGIPNGAFIREIWVQTIWKQHAAGSGLVGQKLGMELFYALENGVERTSSLFLRSYGGSYIVSERRFTLSNYVKSSASSLRIGMRLRQDPLGKGLRTTRMQAIVVYETPSGSSVSTVSSTGSGDSGSGGSGPGCDHDVCTTGSPLDSSCDPCAAIVCSHDPVCCEAWWDGICVTEANQYCGLCEAPNPP